MILLQCTSVRLDEMITRASVAVDFSTHREESNRAVSVTKPAEGCHVGRPLGAVCERLSELKAMCCEQCFQ